MEEVLIIVYLSFGIWFDFEIVVFLGVLLVFVVFCEENSVGVIDMG